MEIDYEKLCEPGPGDRPYKGYYVLLGKGYVRVMASRLDKDGMVVSVNYYGKTDARGELRELNRVDEKRQSVAGFEDELARFKAGLKKSGFTMFIEDRSDEAA